MYKNILFAIEFTHAENLAGKTAKQLADLFKAKLSLIHVVELPTMDVFPDVLEKESLYVDAARNELAERGKSLNITPENQYVEIGNPKIVIPEHIKRNNIDLLIVGHHERKGLYHLLGSTTQALLSTSKCAVLVLPYPGF